MFEDVDVQSDRVTITFTNSNRCIRVNTGGQVWVEWFDDDSDGAYILGHRDDGGVDQPAPVV